MLVPQTNCGTDSRRYRLPIRALCFRELTLRKFNTGHTEAGIQIGWEGSGITRHEIGHALSTRKRTRHRVHDGIGTTLTRTIGSGIIASGLGADRLT